MSEGTPGPWRIEPASKGCAFPIIQGHDRSGEVAVVFGTPGDARLIAAAPDLLALAQYAVDNPEFDSEWFEASCRSVLAKVDR